MSKLALQLIAEAKRTKAKTLDLGKCGLTELPDELFELVRLEELYVCNRYWDYEKRKRIESKNKGENNSLSTIPEAIANLQHLQKLYLGEDWDGKWFISDISVLASLENLTTLYLISNQISDISVLASLENLTTLYLRENQISDISVLASLENLTTLYLIKNQISDISVLASLENLTTLYLISNQISDISVLASLENLTTLDLCNNQISDILVLASLENLTTLDLSSNQISDISVLASLENLTTLDLSSTQISDISVLASLENLTTLYLRENQISDISVLASLENLTTLYLSSNQISDISVLASLENLTTLYLSSNQISDISVLASLENLTTLYLSSNQISDISVLASLENLTNLDLNRNQIIDIRPLKSLIKKGIAVKLERFFFQGINLFNNPLGIPPKEIVEQGNQAILNYFEQLEKEDNKEEYLFEAKLLIIGEGGAGKTTFARRLQNPTCDLPTTEESTHDITIDTWEFVATTEKIGNLAIEKEPTFYANLWDFGGQEIYHSTHQFFFSRKCFYVLLADTREQKTDFNYWLNTIEQLGGEESSLLIVLNERNQHKWQLDINGYRTRFGDLIKTPKSLDLSDSTKIPALQQSIQEHLYQLPNIAQPLIASWVQIREELAKIDKNYISYDDFERICHQYKITKQESIENISRYFTRIGVFTHFIDDDILEERIYLNSNWLVKTVYKLLNDNTVKNKQGRVTKADITSIWDKNELGREIKKLKALLHKFGLMYKVERKDEFIIPIYLPDQQPYEQWPHQNETNILHFRYEFDKYMPKGLMSRLIVAVHDKIDDHDLVWNRGVNLAHHGAKAEIIRAYGGKNIFDIRIVGTFQRDLLVLITTAFDKILSDFQKLAVEKSVKCPCSKCTSLKIPYFHSLETIQNTLPVCIEENDYKIIRCGKSIQKVSIFKLLGQIDIDGFMEKTKQENPRLWKELEDIKRGVEATYEQARKNEEIIKDARLDNFMRHKATQASINQMIDYLEEKVDTHHQKQYKLAKTILESITHDNQKMYQVLAKIDKEIPSLLQDLPQELKSILEKVDKLDDTFCKIKLKLPIIFGENLGEIEFESKKLDKWIKELARIARKCV